MFHQAASGIVLALLLGVYGAQAATRPASSNTAPACHYIDPWRGTNVPISPATSSSDIVHALAITKAGNDVGWLVVRRDGKLWYLDGPVRGPLPPMQLSAEVLRAIGHGSVAMHTQSIGRGRMIPIGEHFDIGHIIAQGFLVTSCY